MSWRRPTAWMSNTTCAAKNTSPTLRQFATASDTPFDQSLITGAAGASYLLHYRRYEPYVHAMGGYTRLASQHAAGGMYLSNVNSGFMMLFGAGLDVKVSERWGVRAISLEDLYLPFGSARSTYWSVGSGVLYHFGRAR